MQSNTPNVKRDQRLRRIPNRKVKYNAFEPFWNIETVRAGFERYKKEHGNYPTGPQIDAYDYLPSSRQIERKFGGLRLLRTRLGLEVKDYRTGENRSRVSAEIGVRGHDWENRIERKLIEQFDEAFVHREQPIEQSTYADFLVYAKNKTFAIDIFYPHSFHSLIRNLQIKLLTYHKLTTLIPVFLIYLNEEIDRIELKRHLIRKTTPIPKNFQILSGNEFLQLIQTFVPLEIPDGLIKINKEKAPPI